MLGALEYWSKHLRAIVVEGVTTKAYAEREGLSAARLYWWRSRLASEVSQGREAHDVRVIAKPVVPPPFNQFVPLELKGMASPSVRCTLVLGSGLRLELIELPPAAWLTELGAATSHEVR
ncbi:MAG: cobyrinic acid ac-diamide synthase [Proteobacteria bacterium]|nr:cobyrinic acid ac-diamide synthase [Pseudomonadota bacterium]